MSSTEDEVVRAVAAVCDQSTNNEDRMRYTQALEEFRHNSPPDVVASVGFALIVRNQDVLALNGWNFIEDVIRFKWNHVPVDFRLEVRSKILQALQAGPRELTVDSLSKCMVAMMEHEWPQNWTELIPELDQLSQISSLHCAAVFAIMRRLVENVVTLVTISNAQRRKDMYNGLVLYLPDIIKMALDRLDVLSDRVSGDDAGARTVSYILSWLIEICEWVPSNVLSSHLNRLVDAVIRHLDTPERNIYELASRCLAALADRKKETSEECVVVNAFFRNDIIDAILRTVRLAAESSEANASHYSYLKALCGLLTSLGGHLAKVWSEQSPPPNYGVYLSAIGQIFTHPSLHLKLEACETFVLLGGHAVLGRDEAFHREIENILNRILQAMEKVGYPSQQPVTQSVHYSMMDYDDDLEWNHDFKRLRERSRVLLVNAVDRHYPHMLNILEAGVFERIMNSLSGVSAREWDPMQIFAKIVVQSGFEKNLVSEASRDGLTAMSDSLIKLMATLSDWDLLSEVLSVHSALFPVFSHHAIGLTKYIELLQHILSNSNGHSVLNRHCISQVLRVVSQFPDFFKVNAKLVADMYNAVVDRISAMQVAQLLQVFAALANLVESEEIQMELLKLCISPSVQYFMKENNNFDSVDAFIKFNGFDLTPPVNFGTGEERDDIKRRKELRRNLTSIEGVLQQANASSPLGRVDGVIAHLLPVFFKLNRVALDLTGDNALRRMNSAYTNVSGITRNEKEVIYCSVGESMEAQLGRLEAERRDPPELAKQYVHCLSLNSITIISLIASKFGDVLFNHPSISDMLGSTVASLDIMPAFRLRYWIKKTWRSLIVHCPNSRWNLLPPFYSILVRHMRARLEAMWSQVSAIDYDAEPSEAELFNEHMTCVLSREYLSLLKLIYTGSENNSPKAEGDLTAMGEFLFQEQAGITDVLNTVFCALVWRDTQASIKAIPICKAFTDKLANCYDNEAGVFMLVNAINSLRIHGSDEVASAPLLGLIFHIYITLRKHSESLLRVLQEVPGVTGHDLEVFDKKVQLVSAGQEILPEKKRREMMKKLLQNVISVTASEMHRRPVYLRPLPPIEKRRKEEVEPDFEAVAALFGDV